MKTLHGLHLHIDCASGAAGDMMLAALIDLGVPVDAIGAALDAIGAGRERLRVTHVVKHGIAAVDVKVDTTGELAGVDKHAHAGGHHGGHDDHHDHHDHHDDHNDFETPDIQRTQTLKLEDLRQLVQQTTPDGAQRAHPRAVPAKREHAHGHGHDHTHGHDHHDHEHGHDHHEHEHDHGHDHAHYHYSGIRKRISEAALGEGVKRRALDIFDRLARAEAKLHGSTVDDVAFHEVGAIDSVVDVVGTAAALDWLAPASVTCAAVAMGHGTLHCAHGVLPVPAPAALEVLREAGGVMADGGLARELCTPTGAAILAATVTAWTPAPTGRPVAIGWGAGDIDLSDRANALRVTALAVTTAATDTIWQIDANVDDMSPELCQPAADAVFAAGAVDVWWTPITMKKGRPALTLSALAPADRRDAVIAAILRETTTIGVRYAQLARTVLRRDVVEVATRFGAIPIKVAKDGDAVINAAPEYEACATAARLHGVPVKLVFAAALAAFDRA